MSEYDALIDGFPGLGDPKHDPGPLSEEEGKILASSFQDVEEAEKDEPPIFPDDWPEEETETVELRVLRPDQRPVVGQHYVIFGGLPKPVLRGSLALTEDEFVRQQISESDDLKDPDGQRQQRADRTLRQRFRGYLCGEMNTL